MEFGAFLAPGAGDHTGGPGIPDTQREPAASETAGGPSTRFVVYTLDHRNRHNGAGGPTTPLLV